ncbi:unnamed protein product [Diplocarpon coronariae]
MAAGLTVTYDFSPCLTAPVVRDIHRQYGRPQITLIPDTKTVSPFAPGISPQQVEDLKRWLVGDGTGKGRYKGQTGGEEYWESWKRAWDLWNNHYIEGRTSPVWIRGEYERIRKEMEAAREERIRRRPLAGFPKTFRRGREICETIWSKDEPNVSGKTFIKTGRSKIEPVTVTIARPNPSRTFVNKRKGDVVEVYGEQFIPMEIVQMNRTVRKDRSIVSDWAQVVRDRRNGTRATQADQTVTESTETRTETTYMARQVLQFTNVDITGTQYTKPDQVHSRLLSYDEVSTLQAYGSIQTPNDEETNSDDIMQRLGMWVPMKEPSQTRETRKLDKDDRVSVLTFRNEEVEVLEKVYEWREDDDNSLDDDGDEAMAGADINMDASRTLQPLASEEEPEIIIPLARTVVTPGGESGGFLPMKLLDRYPEPDDDENVEWIDAIQNTLWRPRRVGEKTPRIEMDENLEDGSEETDLEYLGGVDCGRSPYPVLRSVTLYIEHGRPQTKDALQLYRKKKTWDGVTGTVFNTPTKPLEEDKSGDERTDTMSALLGDVYRDYRQKYNTDIYPINIRRVKRLGPERQKIPLLDRDENILEFPWNKCSQDSQKLHPRDPWWVTEEQEKLQNYPPRKYPPVQDEEQTGEDRLILPIEDAIWWEDYEEDNVGVYKYFVTNLHHESLTINGIEIKRGAIAGPLPPFAVIETPGHQFSFWWGVGGRNWGHTYDGTNYDSKWKTLRQKPGWKHVGLTTGQVWDYKIRERVQRELTGNEYADDAEWEAYKRVVPAVEPPAKVPYAVEQDPIVLEFDDYGIPRGSSVAQPDYFASAAEELKWLRTKAMPLKAAFAGFEATPFVVPTGSDFWPQCAEGGKPQQEEALEITLQNREWDGWDVIKGAIFGGQEELISRIDTERNLRVMNQLSSEIKLGEKRRAEADQEDPQPKRTRTDPTMKIIDHAIDSQTTIDQVKASKKVKEAKRFQIRVDAALRKETLIADRAIARKAKAAGVNKIAIADQYFEDLQRTQTEAMIRITALNAQGGGSRLSSTVMAAQIDAGRIRTDWNNYTNQAFLRGSGALQAKLEQERKTRDAVNKAADAARLKKKEKDKTKAADKKKTDEEAKRKIRDGRKNRDAELNAEVRYRTLIDAIKKRQKQRENEAEQPPPPPPGPTAADLLVRAAAGRAEAVRALLAEPLPGPDFSVSSIRADFDIDLSAAQDAFILQREKWMKECEDIKDNLNSRIAADDNVRDILDFLTAAGFTTRGAWIRAQIATPDTRSGPSSGQDSKAPPETPDAANGAPPGLIRRMSPPQDRFISVEIANNLAVARHAMRDGLQAALTARAEVENRQEIDVVRERGYLTVDGYLYNLSTYAFTPDQIHEDPDNTEINGPPVLRPNATALERLRNDTAISVANAMQAEITRKNKERNAKRMAVAQKIYDANEFEVQAQALEKKRPAAVDITLIAAGRGGRSMDV